jgi:hypothetical protein
MTFEERFFAKVRRGEGCWEWTACTTNGYGLFWVDGANRRAHRVSCACSTVATTDRASGRITCSWGPTQITRLTQWRRAGFRSGSWSRSTGAKAAPVESVMAWLG